MTDSGSSEKAQIQEAKRKRMLMKTVLSHIIFQLQKTKNNEKILKENRERAKKITSRGTIKRIEYILPVQNFPFLMFSQGGRQTSLLILTISNYKCVLT